MPKKSAGLLMYRYRQGNPEVLLVHPGGPYWKNKDEGAWMIPKGEYQSDEKPMEAAQREFKEETGIAPLGEFQPLPEITQKGGKKVKVWYFQGDADADQMQSNTFTLEWPPGSGEKKQFPEVDRAAWFDLETAKEKILPSQKSALENFENQIV